MSGTLHCGEPRVGGTRAQAEKWSGLGLVWQGVVWDGTRYDVVTGCVDGMRCWEGVFFSFLFRAEQRGDGSEGVQMRTRTRTRMRVQRRMQRGMQRGSELRYSSARTYIQLSA
jgi:hypothetical protein